MDQIDLRILNTLQKDASGSIADIAERSGTSQTPCWRRIKRMEEEGIIKKKVALLDQEKLNMGLTGFILIRTAEHDEEWLDGFAKGVQEMPEVLEFHRMTGEVDYLLRVVTTDLKSYDAIYKKLIKVAKLSDVSACFSMECLKMTTELPLSLG
jgi:Lrp/AsnC family transcriptional regulator